MKEGTRTARHVPRWSEVRPLLNTQPLELDRTARRLRNAHTIADLRRVARRRVPRGVFDFVDGGAEEEVSLRRAREAFARVEFHPHVLRDVARVRTDTTLLGARSALPLVLAPTGFTRLVHHEGEWAVASAAEQAGIPYCLSTMSTVSIEDIRATAPQAGLWFQLYMWRDRGLSRSLIERAREAGYHALVLTVDVPVAGRRLRDLHNGFTVPPALKARTILDTARYPAWWGNLLTTETLSFANFERGRPDALASVVNTMFDPSVTFDDLAFMRELWPGPLVIKGIQSVDDARRAVELGVEGLVVSNHGGRQLDRAPTPLELLPQVAEAVGDRAEVYFDTGVRTGGDVVAALALGARACMIGRAYLYGLMAGGERGVERALAILSDEIARTLQLIGAGSVEELDSSHAVLRPA